ncbi:MAG: ribonuclease P protein component [Phycisphaerales bacterium]|nr:ribonuclease P protein component [Phycisphaerales bacterium]
MESQQHHPEAPSTGHSTKVGRPRLRLTRSQRLPGGPRVDGIFKKGRRRTHHPLMACAVRREDAGSMRLAISIGKKSGNAVKRNAIRRRIREAYRLWQQEWPPGWDVLLVVRPHKCLTVQEYYQRLQSLLR